MKVTFNDGTIKDCSAPTEQKVFKAGDASGWILSFALLDNMTSAEVDNLIAVENISRLTFSSNNENDVETIIELFNYDKVSSAVIRYNEQETTRVEIHLTKGV